MTILPTKSIYYKDVNLIARPGVVKSRSEIPKNLEKIIVSPMSSICGTTFTKKALNLGLSVCLHRFCEIENQVKLFNEINFYRNQVWACIGLDEAERLKSLTNAGCQNIVLDVANGYLPDVVHYIEHLYYYLKIPSLMVGNIHTKEGVQLYKNIRNLHLRIGIGGGTCCETKNVAAINRGQITEIEECSKKKKDRTIIADGSINSPAYASMAFGTGADKIMLGSYFGNAEEAENVINGEYKIWGSASYEQLKRSNKVKSHSEGKTVLVDKTSIKPLKVLVDELWGGISSAISYSGYSNLDSFIGNGVFELKV